MPRKRRSAGFARALQTRKTRKAQLQRRKDNYCQIVGQAGKMSEPTSVINGVGEIEKSLQPLVKPTENVNNDDIEGPSKGNVITLAEKSIFANGSQIESEKESHQTICNANPIVCDDHDPPLIPRNDIHDMMESEKDACSLQDKDNSANCSPSNNDLGPEQKSVNSTTASSCSDLPINEVSSDECQSDVLDSKSSIPGDIRDKYNATVDVKDKLTKSLCCVGEAKGQGQSNVSGDIGQTLNNVTTIDSETDTLIVDNVVGGEDTSSDHSNSNAEDILKDTVSNSSVSLEGKSNSCSNLISENGDGDIQIGEHSKATEIEKEEKELLMEDTSEHANLDLTDECESDLDKAIDLLSTSEFDPKVVSTEGSVADKDQDKGASSYSSPETSQLVNGDSADTTNEISIECVESMDSCENKESSIELTEMVDSSSNEGALNKKEDPGKKEESKSPKPSDVDSNLSYGCDKMEVDLMEESDEKLVAASPIQVRSDKNDLGMNEKDDEGAEGVNSLVISQVISCVDMEEQEDNDRMSPKASTNDEVKLVDGDLNGQGEKDDPNNSINIEDSEDSCKIISNEDTSLDPCLTKENRVPNCTINAEYFKMEDSITVIDEHKTSQENSESKDSKATPEKEEHDGAVKIKDLKEDSEPDINELTSPHESSDAKEDNVHESKINIEDPQEDSKPVVDEHTSLESSNALESCDDNLSKSAEVIEIVDGDKNTDMSMDRQAENERCLKDSESEPSNLTEKISFKDILKKESCKSSVLNEKSVDEAIIIDEIESAPTDPFDSKATSDKKHDASETNLNDDTSSPAETTQVLQETISTNKDGTNKRSLSNEDPEESTSKRLRLDSISNVSSNQTGSTPAATEAATVIMDSDDDEAVPVPCNLPSDKTVQHEKEDGTSQQPLKLSNQLLMKLIKASLKTFMKNHKIEKEQQIDERMKKMEATTDLWREAAKHLEKSVNELTSYKDELIKSKNHSLKLKHLSNRTVAVQVSMERIHQSGQHTQAKTSNNYNRPSSHSLPPSVLRHPLPIQGSPAARPMVPGASNGHMQPHYSPSSVRSQISQANPRGLVPPAATQQSARPRIGGVPQNAPSTKAPPNYNEQHFQLVKLPPSSSSALPQNGRLAKSMSALNTPTANTPSTFLIDLTDEDDVSRKARTSQVLSGGVNQVINSHHSIPNRGAVLVGNGFIPSQSNQTVRSDNQGGNVIQRSLSNSSSIPNNLRNGNMMTSSQSTVDPKVAVNLNSGNGNRTSANTGSSPSSSRSLPPSVYVSQSIKHPAPLPVQAYSCVASTTKKVPPKPSLKISRVAQGIVLSWNMPNPLPSDLYATIASYQLFAYQETKSAPSSSLWKKVGDVKALPLPMACTLVQFQEGNKYYFAVRAIDQFGRWGEYSDPSHIYLFPK